MVVFGFLGLVTFFRWTQIFSVAQSQVAMFEDRSLINILAVDHDF
jgi:hypothetical protein